MRMLRATVVASLALALRRSCSPAFAPFGDAGLYSGPAAPSLLPSIPPAVRGILAHRRAEIAHFTAQPHVPVYGRFAPISWLLERDILNARKAMNLTRWDTYSTDLQETFRSKIVQETKSRHMPLLQYRIIHWNARITAADLQILTQWAHDPLAPAASATAQATTVGDPIRGKAVFERRCTGCHSLYAKITKVRAYRGSMGAQLPPSPISLTPTRFGTHTWCGTTAETLEKWLTDPDALLPGANMDFRVAKPQERKDLIEYFKQSVGLLGHTPHGPPQRSSFSFTGGEHPYSA